MGRVAGRAIRRLGIGLLAAGQIACATHTERFAPVEDALTRDGPEAALARADGLQPAATDDAALGRLEAGMLLHMAGDYERSNENLEAASTRMDALEPFSFSEGLGSVTVGERLRGFVAAPHERVAVHVIKAFNYIALGQWEEARVEALRIDIRLDALTASGDGFYRDDAFARHVAGMIFEQLGEHDDALIAYRKAYRAYRDQHAPAHLPVPSPLRTALLRLTAALGMNAEFRELREAFDMEEMTPEEARQADPGRIAVIVGNGLAPRKREVSLNAQHPGTGRLYRVAVPTYGSSRKPLAGARVAVPDGEAVDAEVVQDLDAMARETLAERMPGIMARAAVRAAAKNRMVNEAHEEDPFFGVLVNLFTFASERADLRSWSTLPGEYLLAEIPVEPDTDEVRVTLKGRDGREWQRDIPVATVDAGKRAFVFAHSLSERVPFHRAGEGPP